MNNSFTIRKAERKDVGLLLEFIRGIAKYEKMEDEVVAMAETLEAEMFDHQRAEAKTHGDGSSDQFLTQNRFCKLLGDKGDTYTARK